MKIFFGLILLVSVFSTAVFADTASCVKQMHGAGFTVEYAEKMCKANAENGACIVNMYKNGYTIEYAEKMCSSDTDQANCIARLYKAGYTAAGAEIACRRDTKQADLERERCWQQVLAAGYSTKYAQKRCAF